VAPGNSENFWVREGGCREPITCSRKTQRAAFIQKRGMQGEVRSVDVKAICGREGTKFMARNEYHSEEGGSQKGRGLKKERLQGKFGEMGKGRGRHVKRPIMNSRSIQGKLTRQMAKKENNRVSTSLEVEIGNWISVETLPREVDRTATIKKDREYMEVIYPK